MKEAPPTPEGLEVTLVAGAAPAAGQPVTLRLRVKNPTGAPLRFCTYHTLFEGLRNDILDVRRPDGSKLPYRGMMAKRAPPGPKDFLTVPPGGEALSEAVDVSEGYPFSAGAYSVVFTGSDISGLPASAALSLDLQ